jgi:hypothetical protein
VSTERVNNAARDRQLASSLSRISNIVDSVFIPGTSSINGFNIQAGTINASAISAGTFQTSTTGQRVIMSDLDQIRFYDSNDVLSLVMEGTAAVGDGAFAMYSKSMVGNTVAGFPGSSIYINDNYLSISSNTSGSVGSGLYLESDGNMFGGGSVSTVFTSNSISLNGLSINSVGTIQGFNTTSMYSSGQIDSDGNIFGASINSKNNGGFYGGFTSLTGQMASGSISTGSISSGTIIASGSIIRSALVGGGSTGATFANDGSLVRTGSSARYKQDISDTSYSYDDILTLQPKKFRWINEAESDENARYYAGFIAEEIAGTPLDIFVAYQTLEDGTKRPDGVYYAELTSALLSAIKHQDQLIKSLTSRIEALENK